MYNSKYNVLAYFLLTNFDATDARNDCMFQLIICTTQTSCCIEGQCTWLNLLISSFNVNLPYVVSPSGYVCLCLYFSEGSTLTPAHHYSDFRFKAYAPIAFRYFRELFGIQPDDFLVCKLDSQDFSDVNVQS